MYTTAAAPSGRGELPVRNTATWLTELAWGRGKLGRQEYNTNKNDIKIKRKKSVMRRKCSKRARVGGKERVKPCEIL